ETLPWSTRAMTTTMRVDIPSRRDPERGDPWLLAYLHPDGLTCPEGHVRPRDPQPHDRHRAPIVDDECRECDRVCKVFSTTGLTGIRFPTPTIVMRLPGFFKGTPTLHRADERRVDCKNLLRGRPALNDVACARVPPPRRSPTG